MKKHTIVGVLPVAALVLIAIWFVAFDRPTRSEGDPAASRTEAAPPKFNEEETRGSFLEHNTPKPEPFEPKTLVRATPPLEVPFQVLDTVTREPLVGVTLFGDKDHLAPLHDKPSDNKGIVLMKPPEEGNHAVITVARVPVRNGERTATARLDSSDKRIVEVDVTARIVVRPQGPRIFESDSKGEEGGVLWCVSWPTPTQAIPGASAAVLAGVIPDYAMASTTPGPKHATLDVPYHRLIELTAGSDPSQLAVIRYDAVPNEDKIVDLAFEGTVVLDFFLADKGRSRVRTQTQPGMITNVVLPQIISKMITIRVQNERGLPVGDALLQIGAKRTYREEKATRFPSELATTDAQGCAAIRIAECELLNVSVSREGIIAEQFALWSGVELPFEDTFTVKVTSAPLDCAPVTLMHDGRPAANATNIQLTIPMQFPPEESGDALGMPRIAFKKLNTDEQGRVLLDQLTVGKQYVLQLWRDDVLLSKAFRYRPGMTIELKGMQ
jgi:hypothetical protein